LSASLELRSRNSGLLVGELDAKSNPGPHPGPLPAVEGEVERAPGAIFTVRAPPARRPAPRSTPPGHGVSGTTAGLKAGLSLRPDRAPVTPPGACLIGGLPQARPQLGPYAPP
jgi:hypothetical protein